MEICSIAVMLDHADGLTEGIGWVQIFEIHIKIKFRKYRHFQS